MDQSLLSILEPPFILKDILKKKRKIKKELLNNQALTPIKIAVLGGSTTNEVVNMIELFLLKNQFSPSFYQSEYNKFYEDALFPDQTLLSFKPDIIIIHTTNKNILTFPSLNDSPEQIQTLLDNEMNRYKAMWDALNKTFNCPIIQNNFDMPIHRLLGNLECYEPRGTLHFIQKLNEQFSIEAQTRKSLYLHDINYLSAYIGLQNWIDKSLWYTSKYALSYDAFPHYAHSIVAIIKAIKGTTRKCLVLDLDNTLWGGIIGDDGVENIKLGPESAIGEAYIDVQEYVKALKERGIILAVNSKNDDANAKSGFEHDSSVLNKEDITSFQANWNPKHDNMVVIAKEINIGLDSLVFLDDNPVERDLVKNQCPMIEVPSVEDVTTYISTLDSSGVFETVSLSADDLNRSNFYKENSQRKQLTESFKNYDEFLKSLDMKAEIAPFNTSNIDRITQLINKTNQFNLTTKRYTLAQIQAIMSNDSYITLYGRLKDKFGDNGIVSIIIVKIEPEACIIDTWLMSCRVLKRQFEKAMFDVLLKKLNARSIKSITGCYKPTKKNKMVQNLFQEFGFKKEKESEDEVTWSLNITKTKLEKNTLMEISHD
jgi:FkbH-like protein